MLVEKIWREDNTVLCKFFMMLAQIMISKHCMVKIVAKMNSLNDNIHTALSVAQDKKVCFQVLVRGAY